MYYGCNIRIFNSRATHPAFQWVLVQKVFTRRIRCTMEDGRQAYLPGVRIVTGPWETFKIDNEGIAVQRDAS